MNKLYLFFSLITTVLLYSCQEETQRKINVLENTSSNLYAEKFSITKTDSSTILNVFKPWQHSENESFQYSTENFKLNSNSKIVCYSTSHIAFLKALGLHKNIIGVSGKNYVYAIDELNDSIIDVGSNTTFNYELITRLQADVVFYYGVGTETEMILAKCEKMNIPVIIIAEYLETHPLARAEWIKFFGALFQKNAIADSIFQSVESRYNSILVNKENIERPVILTGTPFEGTWWVPGGNSYFAQFIKDAGGTYLWDDNLDTESIGLSAEQVFKKAVNADFWINTGMLTTKKELAAFDNRFEKIKAFSNNKVFNNNKRLSVEGGNDFWESGVMKPHLILRDLKTIFRHSKENKDSLFVYYRKLQ